MTERAPGDGGAQEVQGPAPADRTPDNGTPDNGILTRALMRAASAATLATAGEGGQPFASLVTPAIAEDGAVLLWLSTLSEHTRQLARDPRCALLFLGEPDGPNPQTTPRVTVTGLAEPIEDAGLKAVWLARHPYAELYADFADFGLWRIKPMGGQMVLGFARAHRLRQAELRPAPGEGVAPTPKPGPKPDLGPGPDPAPEGVP